MVPGDIRARAGDCAVLTSETDMVHPPWLEKLVLSCLKLWLRRYDSLTLGKKEATNDATGRTCLGTTAAEVLLAAKTWRMRRDPLATSKTSCFPVCTRAFWVNSLFDHARATP